MHVLVGIVTIICGWFFQISTLDWLMIVIAIGLVLAFEAINTAVEYVVDIASKASTSPIAITIISQSSVDI